MAYTRSLSTSKGVPFLTVRNLTAGTGITFEGSRCISHVDHAEFIKRTNPEQGDILITKDGTLGVVRAVRQTPRDRPSFVSLKAMIDDDRLESVFLSPRRTTTGWFRYQAIHRPTYVRYTTPVAPAAEREEVVKIVHSALAWIDRLASDATSARRLDRPPRPSGARQSLPGRTRAAGPRRRTRQRAAGADQGGARSSNAGKARPEG